MINIDTKSLARLPEDLIGKYKPENKKVFEETEIPKLKEAKFYSNEISLKILRHQIDVNDHVHNLFYLDFAYEALPENVYKENRFDNIDIMYKKQIKYNDKIKCLYLFENNKHTIAIKSDDHSILHAIINLY